MTKKDKDDFETKKMKKHINDKNGMKKDTIKDEKDDF